MRTMDLPGAAWRKNSYSSTNGSCVELVAMNISTATLIAIRDSKNPQGSRLAFSPHAWSRFTAEIKLSI